MRVHGHDDRGYTSVPSDGPGTFLGNPSDANDCEDLCRAANNCHGLTFYPGGTNECYGYSSGEALSGRAVAGVTGGRPVPCDESEFALCFSSRVPCQYV